MNRDHFNVSNLKKQLDEADEALGFARNQLDNANKELRMARKSVEICKRNYTKALVHFNKIKVEFANYLRKNNKN